jgi:glutamine amidotransferase
MKVVIIKYNAGNVCSVSYALERLGINAMISDKAETISTADKVIFPGVGEAGTAMKYLKERGLDKLIRELRQPVLGIFLGLQIMCLHSEESNTNCLGIFPVLIKRFRNQPGEKNKIPQVGWNSLIIKGENHSALYNDLLNNPFVYFVHSFYAETGKYTTAISDYIVPFSASLQKNNFYAVQFHPEKSGKTGELILKKFIEL